MPFHEKTKNIEVECYFICEHIKSGVISYLPTKQRSDTFTEHLGTIIFYDIMTKLDVHNPLSST